MAYLYETHLHTQEGSACSGCPAKMHVRRYKDLGYTGIFITDHFFNGNTAVRLDQPWKGKVYDFMKGYKHAKEEGDQIGLDVFFGWESSYEGTDFLIYGLGEQWLLANPGIETCSIEEQYALVKAAGGYVIHAHPFRRDTYIKKIKLYPDAVDGIEVFNYGNERRDHRYNQEAFDYARRHNLPMTEGSDSHYIMDAVGGMYFSKRLTGGKDFGHQVVGRKGYALVSIVDKR